MTVPHADSAPRSKRLFAWLIAIALPVPFVASYLLAIEQAIAGGAEASTVAVAVESTAWLVVYVGIVLRDRSRSNPTHLRWLLVVMALIPFGVLIWMMLDLLSRGDALGVWSAVPFVVLSPFAVALATFEHRFSASADAVGGQQTTNIPAAEPESGPRPNPVYSGIGATSAELARAAPADTEAGKPVISEATAPAEEDAAAQDDLDTRAPTEADSAEPVGTEARPSQAENSPVETVAARTVEVDGDAPDVSKVTRPSRSRTRLAVGIDRDFWSELTRILSLAGREQGGVALTTISDGMIIVVGVVLPQQIAASSVSCEFSVLDVERVRDALDSLSDAAGGQMVKMTWLHTHPGLSVFLSGTDVATSANWRNLDPDFKPIVVDVTRSELADQIGVFGPDNRPISPIGVVRDAIDPGIARRIRQAVLERYEEEQVEAPEVIIGPAFSRPSGNK